MSEDKSEIGENSESSSEYSDLIKFKDYLANSDGFNVNLSDQLKLAIVGEMLSGKSTFMATLRNSCINDSKVAQDFFEISENGESQVKTRFTFKAQNESEYSTELDEIWTQLHNTDKQIEETRQNTVRLGIETRSMLDDLRKQLG